MTTIQCIAALAPSSGACSVAAVLVNTVDHSAASPSSAAWAAASPVFEAAGVFIAGFDFQTFE